MTNTGTTTLDAALASSPLIVEPPFTVRFERITPERAEYLLRSNDEQNRNLSKSRIERYTDDLRNGFWVTTHQGIAFDEGGVLMDGQHRLYAIKESGKAATLLVAYNVPRDYFWYTDGGYARNAQSFLTGTNGPLRAALGRAYLNIKERNDVVSVQTVAMGNYASHRILSFLERNDGLREYGTAYATAAARAARKQNAFNGTSGHGLLIGGFLVGEDRWTSWWEDVEAIVTNDGLPDGNPVRALANAGPISSENGGTRTTGTFYMRAIYAALKYREDEVLRTLRINNYREMDLGAVTSGLVIPSGGVRNSRG